MNHPQNNNSKAPPKLRLFILPMICWTMLILAFIYHFSLVWKYAVDIPFWDDWSHLPTNSGLSWIVALHNEHRYPVTRLIVWLMYKINGWDIAAHQIINFLLYGGLVLTTVMTLAKWVPGWKPWKSASFGIILMSPVAIENHQWATQTSWHTYLLFTIASVVLLFKDKPSKLSDITGAFMAIGSIYSIASGIPGSLVILLVWTSRHFTRKNPDQHCCRRLIGQWCLVGPPILVAIMIYFIGYHTPPSHQSPAAPWDLVFWKYYGTMIGNAFAVPRTLMDVMPFFGIFVLIVYCLLPLGLIRMKLHRNSQALPSGYWCLIALSGAFLAGIALIALGRGHFPLGSAYSGRYAELGLFLIPVGAASWYWALGDHTSHQRLILSILFVGFFCAHGRLYSRFSWYPSEHQKRTAQIALISAYYASPTTEPYYLPDFWVTMNPYFQEAKNLNLSFHQKIVSNSFNNH